MVLPFSGKLTSKKHLKGWNMIELVLAITIIAILGTATAAITIKNVRKANVDKTASFLQILATDLGDAYNDLGVPEIATDSDGVAKFKNFLTEAQDTYLSCTFDLDTVKAQTNGFSVEIKSPKDAFGNKYFMECITVEGKPSFSRISSKGPDNISSMDTYNTQEFGDDILVIVQSK